MHLALPSMLTAMMWHLFCLLAVVQLATAQSTAISVADVPQCAKDCLSNSTSVVATSCTSLNVGCLCRSPEFVSTFYCCLSTQCKTSEQATALTFNQQQCAAVNATAPDFVGCSPLKATSSTGIRSSTSTTQSSSTGLFSTIAGIVTETMGISTINQVTATFAGAALLTGTCTAPVFALATVSNHAVLFPEVGCAPNRKDCCPFDISTNAVITRCPQDYFTTAGACCPSGYQPYSAAIGAETPCFSTASTTLIPASTPSVPGLSIITNEVFSRRYVLAQPASNALSAGSIAAISVVSSTLVAITAVVFWWAKHRKTSQAPKEVESSFPAEEPVLPPSHDTASPHELASPEIMGYRSPIRRFWPISGFSSPPAYEKDSPLAGVENSTPHELPGDTYINEHHPAFDRSESVTGLSADEVSPKTPMRSPLTSTTASPAVTPVREDNRTRTMSPGIISPLGSPRIPRTITDQSIVSEKE